MNSPRPKYKTGVKENMKKLKDLKTPIIKEKITRKKSDKRKNPAYGKDQG